MRRCFSLAFLIIGSIVGAGFASGKELIAFFSSPIAPFNAVICGILVFLLSAAFLFVGSKIEARSFSDVSIVISGKFHVFLDMILLFNSFVVLAAMLAGMDSLGSLIINIKPAFSILFGICAIFIVCKGIKGILNCSLAIVPLMVFVLILVCGISITRGVDVVSPALDKQAVSTSTVYVCMNMMLASTILSTGGKIKTRTIIFSSLIAGIIMTVLILLQIYALNSSFVTTEEMPLLALSKAISPILYYFTIAIIAISIFTTMLTAMSGLTTWFSTIFFDSKLFSASIVLIGAYILSNMGFSNVVGFLYPVIGILGLVYALLIVVYIIKNAGLPKPCNTLFNSGNPNVHKRSKTAQNNC